MPRTRGTEVDGRDEGDENACSGRSTTLTLELFDSRLSAIKDEVIKAVTLAIDSKFDELRNELKDYTDKEVSGIIYRVERVEKRAVDSVVEQVKPPLDDVTKCLVIKGLPFKQNETREELEGAVLRLFDSMGVRDEVDVQSCKLLGDI